MAAMIEYVCTAQHGRHEDPSVTLEQGSWAYCSWGASAGHRWTRIDPTTVEALRSTRARPASGSRAAQPRGPGACIALRDVKQSRLRGENIASMGFSGGLMRWLQ